MAKKVAYSKLSAKTNIADPVVVEFNGLSIEVNQYLPMEDKANLLEWVVSNTLDEQTGRFSPIRLDVFFYIALAKWYGNITFTDKQLEKPDKIYDQLVTNDIIINLIGAIPEEEYAYLEELLDRLTSDIEDYNCSFAGMVRAMSGQADGLGNQINTILTQIKNREGIELLGEIRNIMGSEAN